MSCRTGDPFAPSLLSSTCADFWTFTLRGGVWECFGSLQEVMISGVSVWCEGFDLFFTFFHSFAFTFDICNSFLGYFLFQSWSDISTPQCFNVQHVYPTICDMHFCAFIEGWAEGRWERRRSDFRKPWRVRAQGRSDGSTNDALKRWILDPRWSKSTEVSTRSQAAVKCQHELKCANIWDWRITFNITKKQVYLSKGHLDQNAGSFIFWLNPFPFQVPIERRYCDYIFNTSVERQRLNIPQLIALFGDKFCKSTWPQKVVQYTSPLLPMTPS